MTFSLPIRWLLAIALGMISGPVLGQAPDRHADGAQARQSVLQLRRLDSASERTLLVEVEEEVAQTPAAPPPALPIPLSEPEEDAYAPLGVRVGTFLVFPSIEARIGHSDNIGPSASDPQSGTYRRLLPIVEFRSDWNRHELRGRVGADHRSYRSGSGDETTSLEAEIGGRIDIRSGLQAELRVSYAREPESRGDPNVPSTVRNPPDAERLRGEGSLMRQIGRTRFSVRGAMERNAYDDAVLMDGSTIDNGDRNHVSGEAAMRASLDVTEGSAIFLETGVNRRSYRRRLDDNGVIRGSRGYEVLAGVEFRLNGLLTGEIGAGYQHQRPDATALPDIAGLIFRGSLVWQPTALTTVTVAGAISAEESTLYAEVSGARVYASEVELAHALRRNLIATGLLGYSRWDYVGSFRHDDHLDAGLGLEYLASRWLSFTAQARHLRVETNAPDEGYEENRIELGVRVRR